jgi:sulfite exporter TauE/SafE
MTQLIDISALFTALFAGILGSGHCFGMCGGIAAGLGSLPGHDAGKPQFQSALLFNLGRILSYTVLGLISAWILLQAGQLLNVPEWSIILRLVTALMILLIGLQFLFNWQLLAGIERAGARLWKLVLPLAVKASSLPGGSGRLLLGLCWGLLPCGLVYSILLTAAAAGSPLAGAGVMFAFGLGTLPSMLGMSLAAPTLAAILSDQWTRRLMGIAMILLAVLSVSLIVVHSQGHHEQHSNMKTSTEAGMQHDHPQNHQDSVFELLPQRTEVNLIPTERQSRQVRR